MLAMLYRDGDAAAYRAELARRADAPLFFLHIPKTAGTSLTHELHRVAPDYRNIFADDFTPGTPVRERLVRKLADEAAALATEPASAYSSHATMRDLVTTGWPLGSLRLVTMLRDPVERSISDYLYQCSPRHPPSAEFRARFPTIEEFVRAPNTQDKCARFLGRHPRASADETIELVLTTFAFVGLIESYALSARMITALAGEARDSESHERVTSREGFAADAAVRDLIAEHNQRDLRIYGYFREKLAEHSAEFAAIAGEMPALHRLGLSHEKSR